MPHSAADIAARLTDQIEALCRHLLPGGHREGHEWRAGSIRGEPGKSLGVHLSGAKAGVWADFAAGESGDALDLVKAALGLETPAAVAWGASWLGLGEAPAGTPPAPRPRPAAAPGPATGGPGAEADRNVALARRIWSDAVPIGGTPAETYLRARSITCPLPPSLRYIRRTRHGPSAQWLPAMIGAVQRLDPATGKSEVRAVHRTFLTTAGAKAAVDPVKMTLGPVRGGAVRLGKAGPALAVAEGLETALSIATASPETPVWAALSTSGMRALVLPETVRTVILCPDGDPEGQAAAQHAADRFLDQGRKVLMARPPDGADLNDVLTGKATARSAADPA
jgi:hypothetical protein